MTEGTTTPTRAGEPAGPAHHTLNRPDGNTVAAVATPADPAIAGPGRPGVVFLGGLASSMAGDKALFLEAWCRDRGLGFVRFDPLGHGVSSGRFVDGTVGRWRDDALAVIDGLTEGPLVLVGSSMGAWLAVLAARARPDRVVGLVTVAAAPDFTEDLIRPALPPEAVAALEADGVWHRPSRYDDGPYPIARRLLDEARDHLVLRDDPVRAPMVPLRALHGLADPDVPWRQSLALVERWPADDARLTLIKDGDHRLSRPADLALLASAVEELAT
jgi:pimeloyl-ACP methyl ester carboxylesterase